MSITLITADILKTSGRIEALLSAHVGWERHPEFQAQLLVQLISESGAMEGLYDAFQASAPHKDLEWGGEAKSVIESAAALIGQIDNIHPEVGLDHVGAARALRRLSEATTTYLSTLRGRVALASNI